MFKIIKENKKIFILSSYIILLCVFLLNINSVIKGFFFLMDLLMPLFIALGIAFVLNMPMRNIEKWVKKVIKDDKKQGLIRAISIIITLVLTFFVLFLVFSIILPKVIDSFNLVFANFSKLFDDSINSLDKIMKDNFGVKGSFADLDYVKAVKEISGEKLLGVKFENVLGIASGVISNAMTFMNTFMDVFLGFCLSIYLLSGKEKLLFQAKKVLFAFTSLETSKKVMSIAKEAQKVFEKFVGGQLINCAMIGGICYVTYLIFRFPFPELNAAIVTVLSIIPVFGPLAAMVISFILIFAFSPIQAVIFVIAFQVVTNIESNVIYPKVVGSSIGLPGVWVLLSIFILGDLFGIAGMLFAVPITALLYSLFRDLVNKKLVENKHIKILNNKTVSSD